MTSRRSEWTAWALTLGLGAALFIGAQAFGSFAAFVWIFEGFLLLSALSISLGNWVDRKSVIRVDAQGIAFENGLRSVRLTWPEVQNVAVAQTRSGKRVQVIGPSSHFSFKLLTETYLFGQSFRAGFAAGQKILDTVVKSSGLRLKGESEGLYYYARA
ncbi:MAG: hypothetical protein AB1750_11480 [Chloroflexota bacterium]